MIALTGATGNLGKHVVLNLLQKKSPQQFVVVVRDPAKAQWIADLGVEVRSASYDDPEALSQAFKGVDQLLLISSSEIASRLQQHQNVIAAAQKAKVQHVIYTSILNATKSPLILAKDHQATEKLLQESGLVWTFLRNSWYIENHTENLSSAEQHGVILGAAGEGRFSSATREDLAKAAVRVLSESILEHKNKIYELAGSESFNLTELAQMLTVHFKKPVSYINMPGQAYAEKLTSFGVPAGFAQILADSDEGASKGFLSSQSTDLEKLLGAKPTSIRTVLKI